MKAIKLVFLALLLIVSSSFVASGIAMRSKLPAGLIAFIRNDQAFVLDVARGLRYPLANSQRVVRLEIAPRGGAVVFFVRIHPAKNADDTSSALRGFISLSPYKKAFALPMPFGQIPFYSRIHWQPDGHQWVQNAASRLSMALPRIRAMRIWFRVGLGRQTRGLLQLLQAITIQPMSILTALSGALICAMHELVRQ